MDESQISTSTKILDNCCYNSCNRWFTYLLIVYGFYNANTPPPPPPAGGGIHPTSDSKGSEPQPNTNDDFIEVFSDPDIDEPFEQGEDTTQTITNKIFASEDTNLIPEFFAPEESNVNPIASDTNKKYLIPHIVDEKNIYNEPSNFDGAIDIQKITLLTRDQKLMKLLMPTMKS